MSHSIQQIWKQHRSNLHHSKNHTYDSQVEYITSGLSSRDHQSSQGLFNKYPTSPLNLPGCTWTPLCTTESGSIIIEQGILTVKKTISTKLASTAKSVISDSTEKSYTFDGSQMNVIIHTLLSGWSPVELTIESFRSLNLRMILTVEYNQDVNSLIQNFSVFWDQSQLLQQLGVWKWIDEMKPGPALKNFVMRLPLQISNSIPLITNTIPIQNHTPFTSTKVNCRQVGGMTNILITDDPVPFTHQSFTKVHCRQVGGVDHFNTTDDQNHNECHQTAKSQSQFSLSDMMKPDTVKTKNAPHLKSHISF